jgi:hypothetical protein
MANTKGQTIMNTLRARLIERGSNIDDWARSHGYKEGTARRIIVRFAGKDKRPQADSLSRQIIDAIEAETGVQVCG